MPLSAIFFIAGFVTLFGIGILWGASKVGKVVRDKVKSESYECGLPAEDKGDTKVSIKFYLTAILFIVFDIEIIFMYPWATSYRDFISAGQGWYALTGMAFFLMVFIFGLWWEVRSKALEWE